MLSTLGLRNWATRELTIVSRSPLSRISLPSPLINATAIASSMVIGLSTPEATARKNPSRLSLEKRPIIPPPIKRARPTETLLEIRNMITPKAAATPASSIRHSLLSKDSPSRAVVFLQGISLHSGNILQKSRNSKAPAFSEEGGCFDSSAWHVRARSRKTS